MRTQQERGLRARQKPDGNESDNLVKGSIAVSGGKVKPALSIGDDSNSSSEKEIPKKTKVTTRKSMRDDEGFKRKQKERHVKPPERKLMTGSTLLFYSNAPHGKRTA